jgi:hypothetical protein
VAIEAVPGTVAARKVTGNPAAVIVAVAVRVAPPRTAAPCVVPLTGADQSETTRPTAVIVAVAVRVAPVVSAVNPAVPIVAVTTTEASPVRVAPPVEVSTDTSAALYGPGTVLRRNSPARRAAERLYDIGLYPALLVEPGVDVEATEGGARRIPVHDA